MPVTVVYDHLPRCAAQALAGQDELSSEVAEVMHDAAKQLVPVRTGALRNGIQLQRGNPAEVTASSLEGGAPREYAQYNEYGTRYMSANPFMMPGFVRGLAAVPVKGREYGRRIEAVA